MHQPYQRPRGRNGNVSFGPQPVRDPEDRLVIPILGIVAGAERSIRTTTPAQDACPQCGNNTLYNAVSERTARILFLPFLPLSNTRQELSVCVNTACGYRGPATTSRLPSSSTSTTSPVLARENSVAREDRPPSYMPGDSFTSPREKKASLTVLREQV